MLATENAISGFFNSEEDPVISGEPCDLTVGGTPTTSAGKVHLRQEKHIYTCRSVGGLRGSDLVYSEPRVPFTRLPFNCQELRMIYL